jgi:hypothetical protein
MYCNLTAKGRKAPADRIIFQALRYDDGPVVPPDERSGEPKDVCLETTLKLFYRPFKTDLIKWAAAVNHEDFMKELSDLKQLISELQAQVQRAHNLQNTAAMNHKELSDLRQLTSKLQVQTQRLRKLQDAAAMNRKDFASLAMELPAKKLLSLFAGFRGRVYPDIYCLELEDLHSLSPQKFNRLTTLIKDSIYQGMGLEKELDKFMLALNSARIYPERKPTPSSATSTSASEKGTTAKNPLLGDEGAPPTPPVAPQPAASTLAWLTTLLCPSKRPQVAPKNDLTLGT